MRIGIGIREMDLGHNSEKRLCEREREREAADGREKDYRRAGGNETESSPSAPGTLMHASCLRQGAGG